MRSGPATADTSRPRARHGRCRVSTSGRSGTSPTSGATSGPRSTYAGSAIEVAPTVYRDLLDGAWTSLQTTGHGHDRILIGELAPAGVMKGAPGLFNAMAPLRFLRALYCVDAELPAAARDPGRPARLPDDSGRVGPVRRRRTPACSRPPGFADHPYSFTSLPPNARIPDEPDFAELAAMPTSRGDAGSPAARLRLVTRSSRSGRPSSATSPTRPTPSTDHHPGHRRVLPQLGRVHDLAGPPDQVLRPVPDRRSAGHRRSSRPGC